MCWITLASTCSLVFGDWFDLVKPFCLWSSNSFFVCKIPCNANPFTHLTSNCIPHLLHDMMIADENRWRERESTPLITWPHMFWVVYTWKVLKFYLIWIWIYWFWLSKRWLRIVALIKITNSNTMLSKTTIISLCFLYRLPD